MMRRIKTLIATVGVVLGLSGTASPAGTISGIWHQTLSNQTALGTVGATTEYKKVEVVDVAIFQLDVATAATDAIDTLDITISMTADDDSVADASADWTQVAAFTQIVGNGGAKREYLYWTGGGAAADADALVDATSAVTAGTVRQGGVLGTRLRIVATIVDADANAAFTYTVKMIGK